MNDQTIEQEIQVKGKTAPRVTPADVEACIASSVYFTAFDGFSASDATEDESMATCDRLRLLTFCVLVTTNGHTITGESHCQDPAKFDAEIGRTEARKDAINKLWPMAVYAARQQAAAPARKPYTWADVGIHQAHCRDFDGMLVFTLHMRDGCIYEGSIPAGHR